MRLVLATVNVKSEIAQNAPNITDIIFFVRLASQTNCTKHNLYVSCEVGFSHNHMVGQYTGSCGSSVVEPLDSNK